METDYVTVFLVVMVIVVEDEVKFVDFDRWWHGFKRKDRYFRLTAFNHYSSISIYAIILFSGLFPRALERLATVPLYIET